MSILKTTGLVAGHYECRSLAETLPVLTDLLAMEIIERTASLGTLKHPNTEWRLIVHEGGTNAPEKSFDNHYGLRVAHHAEVEAAWKHLEANKDKYGLSKITKPRSAHFAYSIYFREPGGNHLELEYYNRRRRTALRCLDRSSLRSGRNRAGGRRRPRRRAAPGFRGARCRSASR